MNNPQETEVGNEYSHGDDDFGRIRRVLVINEFDSGYIVQYGCDDPGSIDVWSEEKLIDFKDHCVSWRKEQVKS
jgi:hypothetical protein